jgi:hypothetical protein
MGKSKGKKKVIAQTSSKPYEAAPQASGESSTNVGILGDLVSLEESKRVNACKMLVGIFESGTAPIEAIASEKVLAALSQRMADTSEVVKLEAAGALHNMASTLNSRVGERMVSSGVFSTAIGFIKAIWANGNAVHGGSAAMSIKIMEQLLACLAGIVASHDIPKPDSDLLDSQFYSLLLKISVEGPQYRLRKDSLDLLAVMTDGNEASCKVLCNENGLRILQQSMSMTPGAEGSSQAMSTSETSLLALGSANIVLNIFSTLPAAQEQCELLPILKAAFISLPLSPETQNLIMEGAVDQTTRDAIEVVKTASEFISNAAALRKSGEEEEQQSEAERVCSSSSYVMDIEKLTQSSDSINYLLSAMVQQFELLKGLVLKQIPINDSSISLLEAMDRSSTAIANILGAISDEATSTAMSDIDTRMDNLVAIGEFLLEGATKTTVYVDDKGDRRDGLWPVEDHIDYSIAMNGFVSACSVTLDILSILSDRRMFSQEKFKGISTFLCRALSSSNHDILSKTVGSIISIGSQELLPTMLHALLTNSLLRRMSNPTSFRIALTGGVVDTTIITAGSCIEGVIDLHSGDDLEVLAHFIKFNAIEKLGECRKNIHHDFERLSSKELEDSGELAHLGEVLDNIDPFVEYKLNAIKAAKL